MKLCALLGKGPCIPVKGYDKIIILSLHLAARDPLKTLTLELLTACSEAQQTLDIFTICGYAQTPAVSWWGFR